MLGIVKKKPTQLKTHDLVLDAIIFCKLCCVELENQELKNSSICTNCLNCNWPIQDMLWLGLGKGKKKEVISVRTASNRQPSLAIQPYPIKLMCTCQGTSKSEHENLGSELFR